MSTTRSVLLATLLVLVLSACTVQTGSTNVSSSTPVPGVDGGTGPIRLLGVAVASPGAPGSLHIAGDSAALLLTIANDGTSADALTGATTTAAPRIALRNGDAPPHLRLRVNLPAGRVVALSTVAGLHLELARLREILPGGVSVPVTFRFRDARPLTLWVPVRTYVDVPVDRVHQPST
jgi:copper(I)-binding protein